jgi:hypothetical protein
MQTISSLQKLDEATGCVEEKPLFTVLVIYEDFAAGKHAKETYDFLANRLGREFKFKNLMWKFDVLGHPKMKEMAAHDALEADLIIVSTHGIGELPEEVKSWLDLWVEQPGNAMALVMLVDRPKSVLDDHESIRSSLQAAAGKAGIEFFAQPDDWPDDESDFSLQQISERARKTSTVVADLVCQHAGSHHWETESGYQNWRSNG